CFHKFLCYYGLFCPWPAPSLLSASLRFSASLCLSINMRGQVPQFCGKSPHQVPAAYTPVTLAASKQVSAAVVSTHARKVPFSDLQPNDA
ncbi:MAG: hypothetical protein IJU95_06820, partial [Treponema sp.]|nr:hypothetical protein [Treponema sp.]